MRNFLRRVFAFFSLLLALALVGSACTITIGPYGDTGGTEPQKTLALPDPQGESGNEQPLDAAQQARKEEADWHIANVVYKGGKILSTIQLPSGDILDFISRDTLPAVELPTLPFALLVDHVQRMAAWILPGEPVYDVEYGCLQVFLVWGSLS